MLEHKAVWTTAKACEVRIYYCKVLKGLIMKAKISLKVKIVSIYPFL